MVEQDEATIVLRRRECEDCMILLRLIELTSDFYVALIDGTSHQARMAQW